MKTSLFRAGLGILGLGLMFFVFSPRFKAEEPASSLERFEYLETKMAVPVRLIFYTDSPSKADEAAAAVYRRFDELNDSMSDWSPESEIVRACRTSGQTGEPVPISTDLFRVLEQARFFCEKTGGAFDPTVSPVVKLWRRSRSFGKRPPEKNLAKAKSLVGLDQWSLTPPDGENRPLLAVAAADVRLDLGGIAKGFAIDEGFDILKQYGFSSILVDAGGDMRLGDAPPDKEGWTISIASLDKEQPLETISAANRAIACSGDSFQFVEIDGVRYSHIIDPRSGEPLTGRCVVSVFAPTASAADALASAVSVLGIDEGGDLIESLPDTNAVILIPGRLRRVSGPNCSSSDSSD